MRNIIKGLTFLVRGIPLAIIVYIALLAFLWISKKRRFMQFKLMIIEFVFIMYIIAIPDITGIIGMQINIDWFKNSLSSIDYSRPFGEGGLEMLILNMVLFIPLGALVPMVIQNIKWNWRSVLLVGFSFSVGIEFLQMFGGRMSELDDILMNSLGALVGYGIFWICQCVSKTKKKS